MLCFSEWFTRCPPSVQVTGTQLAENGRVADQGRNGSTRKSERVMRMSGVAHGHREVLGSIHWFFGVCRRLLGPAGRPREPFLWHSNCTVRATCREVSLGLRHSPRREGNGWPLGRNSWLPSGRTRGTLATMLWTSAKLHWKCQNGEPVWPDTGHRIRSGVLWEPGSQLSENSCDSAPHHA